MFTLIAIALLSISLVAAQEAVQDGTGEFHDEIVAAGGQDGEGVMASQKLMVQDGTYTGVGGKQMMLSKQANNRFRLEVGEASADCQMELRQEQIAEQTKLYARLSSGDDAEVKVMPDSASETALERLRLRDCSGECTLELKEIGTGEQARIAYELKTERNSKVLGLFQARMQVQTQVDADTGELIQTRKPWWAFLATEAEE